MTNGINTDGFANTKPGATNNIDANYSPATGSLPAAADKSSQDGAGLNAGGK